MKERLLFGHCLRSILESKILVVSASAFWRDFLTRNSTSKETSQDLARKSMVFCNRENLATKMVFQNWVNWWNLGELSQETSTTSDKDGGSFWMMINPYCSRKLLVTGGLPSYRKWWTSRVHDQPFTQGWDEAEAQLQPVAFENQSFRAVRFFCRSLRVFHWRQKLFPFQFKSEWSKKSWRNAFVVITIPRHIQIQIPPEVWYLDPKLIPETPNCRRHDWMSRVCHYAL